MENFFFFFFLILAVFILSVYKRVCYSLKVRENLFAAELCFPLQVHFSSSMHFISYIGLDVPWNVICHLAKPAKQYCIFVLCTKHIYIQIYMYIYRLRSSNEFSLGSAPVHF